VLATRLLNGELKPEQAIKMVIYGFLLVKLECFCWANTTEPESFSYWFI